MSCARAAPSTTEPGAPWGVYNVGRPRGRLPVSRTANACLWTLTLLAISGARGAPRHRVPDGFVIEQAAGDRQVRFPMFAAFDDRGRLFVAESSGGDLYAEISARTRKCRVSLLEDKDGDGRYETVSVFAEKLNFPM